MNGSLLGKSLGVGLATGVILILVSVIVLIPVSFMMNRYIYHTLGMRIAIGIFCGIFSFPIFILLCALRIIGRWPRTHYFGLVPVYPSYTQEDLGNGWIMPFILKIIYSFRSMLTMTLMDGGKDAYIKAIEVGMNLLDIRTQQEVSISSKTVKVCPGAVCEAFAAATQQVGTIGDAGQWTTEIGKLSETGTRLADMAHSVQN